MENETIFNPPTSSSSASSVEKQEDETLDKMEKGDLNLKGKTTEGEERRASNEKRSEEEDNGVSNEKNIEEEDDQKENLNEKRESKTAEEIFVESPEIVEEGNSCEMKRLSDGSLTEWEEFGETPKETAATDGMSKHPRKDSEIEGQTGKEIDPPNTETLKPTHNKSIPPLKKPFQQKWKGIGLMIQRVVALAKAGGQDPDLSHKNGEDEERVVALAKGGGQDPHQDLSHKNDPQFDDGEDEEKPQDRDEKEDRDPNNSDGREGDHLPHEQLIKVKIKTTCSTFWVTFFVTLIGGFIAGLAVFLLGNYLVGGKWIWQ